MKSLKLLVIFLVSVTTPGFSQKWTWGMKATGSGQAYGAATTIVNHRGDIVIAGYYEEDFGLGNFTLPKGDDYYSRMYLARINAEHEVQWVKPLHGEKDSYGEDLGLTVDDDQNIYVTGNDNGYIFVSKYDSLGNIIWHNDLKKKHYGYGSAVSIDQYDNVYVSGLGGWNFILTKLDYNGNIVWTKDLWVNYSDGCHITDIEVDPSGNLYFVGVFGIKTLPLDPAFTLQHDSGWGQNLMFGKIDTHGKFLWVKNATGYLGDSPKLALTADNSLYIGGAFAEWFVLPEVYLPGACCNESAPFIAKYKTDGTYVWAKVAESYGGKGVITDIQSDHAGNLYTVGQFFTCYGTFCTESDFYVEKYDKDGKNLWRDEFTMATSDYGKSIDIDNLGNLYLVGANKSENFIDPHTYAEPTTLGVGKLDTEASTYKRTPRPTIQKYFYACTENETFNLFAKGQNIHWYSDADKKKLIKSGNNHSMKVTTTDTLFVTQTVNGIESWPKVIILAAPISSNPLELQGDSLVASQNDLYTYQWYYKNDSIRGASDYYVKVDTTAHYEKFSVAITQGTCIKSLVGPIVSGISPELSPPVRCFPNPTTGQIVLQTDNLPGQYNWQLLTIYGLELARGTQSPTEKPHSIDLQYQPAGTYLLRVQSDKFVQVLKVVRK